MEINFKYLEICRKITLFRLCFHRTNAGEVVTWSKQINFFTYFLSYSVLQVLKPLKMYCWFNLLIFLCHCFVLKFNLNSNEWNFDGMFATANSIVVVHSTILYPGKYHIKTVTRTMTTTNLNCLLLAWLKHISI